MPPNVGKPDFEETFYIYTRSLRFHAYKITKYDYKSGEVVSIGFRIAGVKKGCVNFTLNMDGELYINGVDYNEKCAAEGPDFKMPRGPGTVHMLNTAFSYMLQTHGTAVRAVYLNDASKVSCKFKTDTRKIMLMYSYIALHGKTWYESKFHAVIDDDAVRQSYDKRIEVLTDAAAKKAFDVTRFRMGDAQISESEQDRIRAIYKDSHTFAVFFRNIRNEFVNDYCMVTYRWVDQFIDNVVLQGKVSNFTRWTIPIDRIRQVEFTIAPAADMPTDDHVWEGGGMQTGSGREDLLNWYHAAGTGGLDARYGWELPW